MGSSESQAALRCEVCTGDFIQVVVQVRGREGAQRAGSEVLGTERAFACAYVRRSVFVPGFGVAHTCFGRREAMPPVCTHTGTSSSPFRGAGGRC